MRRGLSVDEWRSWREDGYFVRRAVFSTDELEALRHAAERAVERSERAVAREGESYHIDGNRYHEAGGATIQFEHAPGSRTVRVIEPIHHLDPELDRLVDDARLVGPMCELVGSPRVALFTDKLNLKRPREGSPFRWHQDSPYWTHACAHVERLPNVMLALDDAAVENGCFRVVAGSHREGCLPGLVGEGRLGPLFTDPSHFDAGRQVLLEVPAGSLIFFHPHLVHGSRENRSARKRRALVLTYQPAGHRMFKIDARREAAVTPA